MLSSAQNPTSSYSVSVRGSGLFTITLSSNLQGSSAVGVPDTLYVWNDRYRLAASLSTDSSSSIVAYAQSGDTFYLNSPIPFASVVSSSSPTPIALTMLPAIPVEAFGRCVANAKVHLFNTSIAPGTPASFPVQPGYDTQVLNQVGNVPNTAFPFRIYTDSQRRIYAQAGGANTTLNCMLDGWVQHS
jgi:hypothetical protein